jgi:sarcosine oxidase subunit beta
MAQEETADVVIIGAGIIGCSIALALRRRGFDTLNIDMLPAAGQGSTSFSAAIIRPYYSTIEGAALAYEGHFYWRDWSKFLACPEVQPLARYNQCGCLVLMQRGERLLSTRRILDEVGVPYEVLTGADVSARLPNICLNSFAPPKRIDDPRFGSVEGDDLPGAIFCPTGGFINDPMLVCQNLAQSAQAIGARFLFKSEVANINVEDGAIKGLTLCDGREIRARAVVNAAGPHSSKINALAGVSTAIQTRALRQEVAHVPAPEGLVFANGGVVITDADAGIYMRSELGNHLLIGSLEPKCDTLEWVDPDSFETNHTEQWTNQVWRAALRFPEMGVPNTSSGFVALYDTSSDWIPIYDRSDVDGYFMAIGTSGNQFKNAPIVGQMMCELIEKTLQGVDHDKDPISFHLRHIGRDISLKHFSRNRPVNQASSFSVLG